jgi:glycosyltransferase involved in cell wall biosynthesis
VSNSLPLSVAIITLNEEADLPRCLASVQALAAEIVVVDSGSQDRTAEIARQFGALFTVQPWQGHVAQKNIALQRCQQPWVLCLDADEVLSPELAAAVRAAFAHGEPTVNGFWLNRRNFYLGDWIRHAWYPEWRLRLVRKARATWRGRDPHDRLEVTGSVRRLDGDLLHYPYSDLQDNLQRLLKYAKIQADAYEREGRRFRWYYLVVWPWWDFFKHLVLRQGWRDGWRGWIISFMSMVGTFAKYAFLLEKRLSHADRHRIS